MKMTELLRLVKLNLIQNKFKVVLTSIGIIVGAATIVMVIAIGKGGEQDVAEQFKNLNAGAIDITYGNGSDKSTSQNSDKTQFDRSTFPNSSNQLGGNTFSGKDTNMPNMGDMGGFPGFGPSQGGSAKDRMNRRRITLTMEDMDDLETFVPGISEASISYSTKQDVEGGELEEATSYSIAGVLSNYQQMSNTSMYVGDFITAANENNKEKVCVLGYNVATEIFGSAEAAYAETIYIDNRPYIVNGILSAMGSVSSGISPDDTVFIPYSTGTKYLTSTISPTITLVASDLSTVDTIKEDVKTVLAETYPNSEFTISDAGSKMEAANASNKTLTMLLFAMAVIVFIVGGIGIMNVLFVSIKERTKEIGILKAMGCSKKYILLEFLVESCVISIVGGIIGVALSYIITPIVEYFNMTVILSGGGIAIALLFAVITGTIFGFYPALKASKLVPVEALCEE